MLRICIPLLFLFLIAPNSLLAESEVGVLKKQLEDQSKRIEELEQQLKQLLKMGLAPAKTQDDDKPAEEVVPTPVKQDDSSSVDVGYKKGFYISQKNSEDDEFNLKVNGRMQFRYNGFSRKHRNSTLPDGSTTEQSDQNDFEIERGRLEFSGNVLDPNLQFYLNFDFDTDDNHDVKAHDFWFNYVFDEAFDLYVGKAFVPGSREWLDGSTSTHLIDRSLATSFFRPDRSLGVWAIGEPVSGLYYRAMLANGFKTTDLDRADIDNQFTYALSVWGEPIGDYGSGRADLEFHDSLAVRTGASFTYSPIDTSKLGEPIDEADAVRLSNGARLSDEGALGAGLTVDSYDLFLYAADLALKYRGIGMNFEGYYRVLSDIEAIGGAGLSSVTDKGLTLDAGYFLLESLLEAVVRFSYIDGDNGDSSEYAAGFNYFLEKTHKNKLSFDVSLLDGSPVSSSGPNYLVGADGFLYRIQWQIGF